MPATEYFIMSYFGTRYFMFDYTDSDTIPTDSADGQEITSVISCDIGSFTKENTKYRTLNGNGWESIAPLGNSSEDATFECVREGTGGVYGAAAPTSTYAIIKQWFMEATAGAGKGSPKAIVEIIPRGGAGAEAYEGSCYFVVPNQWTPGNKDTETGQEYSFSVSPFGPQIPLVATYVPATDDTPEHFTFTKAQATQA